MTNVGIIGLGFIGRMHLTNFRKGGHAKVVAVSDKIPENLSGKAAGGGNIAMEGDLSLEGVATYDDGDGILADPNVEAVLISVPTYLHKEYILKSVAAKKHILCEKPMTLTSEEGREVVKALEGYDRVFMVAHCIRFWPVYLKAFEYVREGSYGKVLSGTFYRNSPKPTWTWQGWLVNDARSGGAIMDLHIHDVDFVSYLLGKPSGIAAGGIQQEGEGVQQVTSIYSYDNGAVITLHGGFSGAPTLPFRMQFRLDLEGATLEYNSFDGEVLQVHTADGKKFQADILPGDGYRREQDYFFDCIKRGSKPSIVTAQSSLESIELVEWERSIVDSA